MAGAPEKTERERMMSEKMVYQVTEQEINDAKKEHPDNGLELFEMEMDDGRTFEAIFRKPTIASFQRYLTGCADRNVKNAAQTASMQYIRDSIVAPAFDNYFVIQKNLPALSVQIANELAKGMGFVTNTKKKIL